MIFISKFKRYRITFKGGIHREVNGEKEFIAGIQAAFMDGKYSTQDEDMIARLKSHPEYGITFWSEGENKPTTEGLMQSNEEKERVADLVTSCPHCAFKATSNFGLKAHIRAKHPDK